jgi:peptidyl-prolyl cis-trans isomerase C
MIKKIPLIILLSGLINTVAFAGKVLVTIGKSGQVTEQQLEVAMSAAPFSTQFPSMDEKDQAYLRGDMLLRMARAEALFQEAVAVGKNKSVMFKQEMGNFKTSLLAQRYLTKLRQQIKITKDVEQKITDNTRGNNDAYIAARSAYIAKYFVLLKDKNIQWLINKANVKTYFESLDKKPTADTILAEGVALKIKYADLVPIQKKEAVDKQGIKDKVNEWIKLTLMAKAAVAQGENVDGQLKEYARNLAIRLLLAEKEQQWVPDEQILIDFFQKHPEIGLIPERRQIGQIVLATKQQAEDIKNRIKQGESLFELAGQYSIDPYGKQRSGDMGWLKEGSADKEIELAIKDLKDNEVSEIIKTEKGWHLVTIVTRKPSVQKNYAAIKDRVKQKLIAEKMTGYLQEVIKKHPLQWRIAEKNI